MNWIIALIRWIFGIKEGGVSPGSSNTSSGNLENLLIALEGSSNALYSDPIGLDTIGVGHLVIKNDVNLVKIAGTEDPRFLRSNPLANSQVRALLALDLQKFRDFVRGFSWDLDAHQEDALVSFIFNVGTGSFNKSTMKKYLEGKATAVSIAEQFPRWRMAGGQVMGGLQLRRAVEATIFLGKRQISEYFMKEVPTRHQRRAQDLVNLYWGG